MQKRFGMHTPDAYVISITPFRADGSLDEDGLRKHLQRMANGGIGVYLGGGGSGEGYVLTSDELDRILQIGVAELRGRVPVRAMGTEPRSAADMIAFVRRAADAGVDAVQVYSLDQGHGHRPGRDEIQAYFDDVLSAVSVPCVLSTHQSVGYTVPVDMLCAFLDRYPHVIGVNCTHQDLRYLAAVIDAVSDRVPVHVGGPMQALTSWALGATGFLCSEANLAPELCMAVVEAYRAGDMAVFERFNAMQRLSNVLYGAGGIRATKGVLNRLGLPGGPPRRPQLSVTSAVVDELMPVLTELGAVPQSP
jgi:4-hydroxy-tetrahydrodipicolinate synthase